MRTSSGDRAQRGYAVGPPSARFVPTPLAAGAAGHRAGCGAWVHRPARQRAGAAPDARRGGPGSRRRARAPLLASDDFKSLEHSEAIAMVLSALTSPPQTTKESDWTAWQSQLEKWLADFDALYSRTHDEDVSSICSCSTAPICARCH